MPHQHFEAPINRRFSVEREACLNQACAPPDPLPAALKTASIDWIIVVNAPTLQRLGNPSFHSDCIWLRSSIVMTKLDNVYPAHLSMQVDYNIYRRTQKLVTKKERKVFKAEVSKWRDQGPLEHSSVRETNVLTYIDAKYIDALKVPERKIVQSLFLFGNRYIGLTSNHAQIGSTWNGNQSGE